MDNEKFKVLGEISKRADPKPILVGGAAVELYTTGMFVTGDVDIIGSARVLVPILEEMGFEKDRMYFKRGKIFIHLLRSDLNARSDEISITGTRYTIRVIAIEDLIIERMKGWKWFRSAKDREQAQYLIDVYHETSDKEYLESRAHEEKVTDILKEMVEGPARDQ